MEDKIDVVWTPEELEIVDVFCVDNMKTVIKALFKKAHKSIHGGGNGRRILIMLEHELLEQCEAHGK